MPADGTFAPTGPLVDFAFHPRLLPVVQRRPIMDIAIDVAIRRGNVQPFEIFRDDRHLRIVRARQEVMWEARQLGYTFPMIARRFLRPNNPSGHMDHTSVMWAVDRHESRVREATVARIRKADAEAAMGYRDYLRGIDR